MRVTTTNLIYIQIMESKELPDMQFEEEEKVPTLMQDETGSLQGEDYEHQKIIEKMQRKNSNYFMQPRGTEVESDIYKEDLIQGGVEQRISGSFQVKASKPLHSLTLQPGEAWKHFYCVLPNTDATERQYVVQSRLGVKLRTGPLDNQIGMKLMDRIDSGIFYTDILVVQQDYESRAAVKYSFKKIVTSKESKRFAITANVGYPPKRGKLALKSTHYFDFLELKKSFYIFTDRSDSQGQVERLLNFFLQRNQAGIHGQPQVMLSLLEQLEIDQLTSTPIKDILFSKLLDLYLIKENQRPILVDDIERYIIIVASSLAEPFSQSQQVLLNHLMQSQPFGRFRQLFSQRLHENLVKKGLQIFILACPRIGLEFLDQTSIVQERNDFLKKVIDDQKNHAYMLASMKECIQFLDYKQNIIDLMAVQLLTYYQDSLKKLIQFAIEINKQTWSQTIQSYFIERVQKFPEAQLKVFLQENFEEVSSASIMRKLFYKLLKDIIERVVQKDSKESRFLLQSLIDHCCTDFLDSVLLLNLLKYTANIHLVNLMPGLLTKWSAMSKEFKPSFDSFKRLISLSLSNTLISVKGSSLVESFKILYRYADKLKTDSMESLEGWNYFALHQELYQCVANYHRLYQFDSMLKDLMEFISTLERNKVHAIDTVCVMIESTGVNVECICIMAERLFNIDQSSEALRYEVIYRECMKVVESVFSKLKLEDSNILGVLSVEVVYLGILLGNDVHSSLFLNLARSKVAQLVQSLLDRSTKMQVVQDILEMKPKYMLQIIGFLHPEFPLQVLDELPNLKASFLNACSKYKCFISWAEKTKTVSVDIYQKILEELDRSFLELQIQDIQTRRIWKQFEGFVSIDMLFHFQNSKVFENIFMHMIQQFESESIKEFDVYCHDCIFKHISSTHFLDLLSYPQTTLKYLAVSYYWKGVAVEKISNELQTILTYMKNDYQPDNTNLILIDHLKDYSIMSHLLDRAQTLIAQQQLITNLKSSILDQDFDALSYFVQFCLNLKDNQLLQELSDEVKKVEQVLKRLPPYINENIDALRGLSQGLKVFNAYQIGNGINIIEFLDSQCKHGHMQSTYQQNLAVSQLFSVFQQIEKTLKQSRKSTNSYFEYLNLLCTEFNRQISIARYQDLLSIIGPIMDQVMLRFKVNFSQTPSVNEFVFSFIQAIAQAKSIQWELDLKKSVAKFQVKTHHLQNNDTVSYQDSNIVNLLIVAKIQAEQGANGLNENIPHNAREIIQKAESLNRRAVNISSKLLELIKLGGHCETMLELEGENPLKRMKKRLSLLITEQKEMLDQARQQYLFLAFLKDEDVVKFIQSDSLGYSVDEHRKLIHKLIAGNILHHKFPIDQIESLEQEELLQLIETNFNKHYLKNEEENQIDDVKIDQLKEKHSILKFMLLKNEIEQQTTVLFFSLASGLLPSISSIFFCTQNTTLFGLQTFVKKSIQFRKEGSPFFTSRRFFMIVDYHKLAASVSDEFHAYIGKVNSTEQNSRCFLMIIGINENKSADQSKLSSSSVKCVGKRLSHIMICLSEERGLGKSSFIRSQCKHNHLACQRIFLTNTTQKRDKLIKLHRKILRELSNKLNSAGVEGEDKQAAKLALHYDFSGQLDTSNLSTLLFEILILQCLRDPENDDVFLIPKGIKIFIEIDSALYQTYQTLYFRKLGFQCHLFKKQDMTEIDLKKNSHWGDILMVLNALKDTKLSKKRLKTTTELKDFAIDVSIESTTNKIIQAPIWITNNFLRFTYDQHSLLRQCVTFKTSIVQNYVRQTFQLKGNESSSVISENALDLQHRFLGLLMKSCESIILDLQKSKQAPYGIDFIQQLQKVPILFFTKQGVLVSILNQREDFPDIIRSFLNEQAVFQVWRDLGHSTEIDIQTKLVKLGDKEREDLILKSFENLPIAFTGLLFKQFIALYLLISIFQQQPIGITCTDIDSFKDTIQIYAQITNKNKIMINVDKFTSEKMFKSIIQTALHQYENQQPPKKEAVLVIIEREESKQMHAPIKEMMTGLDIKGITHIWVRDCLFEQQEAIISFYINNYHHEDQMKQVNRILQIKLQLPESLKDMKGDMVVIIEQFIASISVSEKWLISRQELEVFISNFSSVFQNQAFMFLQQHILEKGQYIIIGLYIAISQSFGNRISPLSILAALNDCSKLRITLLAPLIQAVSYSTVIVMYCDYLINHIQVRDSIVKTNSLRDSIPRLLSSIINGRTSLLVGDSGTSKTTILESLCEALQSQVILSNLGITNSFQIHRYTGVDQFSIDEIQAIASKIMKSKSECKKLLILEDCNFEERDHESIERILRFKYHGLAVIIVSSAEIKESYLNENIVHVAVGQLSCEELQELIRKYIIEDSLKQGLSMKICEVYLTLQQKNLRDLVLNLKIIQSIIREESSMDEIMEIVQEVFYQNQSDPRSDNARNSGYLPEARVRANLTYGDKCRNMIVVDNRPYRSLDLILEELKLKNQYFQVFYKEHLDENKSELFLKLIAMIENGVPCIFMGLEQLIPSLFQLIDQQQSSDCQNKLIQINVGTKYHHLKYHPRCKLIFITTPETFQILSHSTTSRFEVHHIPLITDSTEIRLDTHFTNVKQWVDSITLPEQVSRIVFPQRVQSDEFIHDLVSAYSNSKDIEKDCIEQIQQMTTISGALILHQNQSADDKFNLYGEYLKRDYHFSMARLIEKYRSSWIEDPHFKNSNGFNLIIHTLSKSSFIVSQVRTLSTFVYKLHHIQTIDDIRNLTSKMFRQQEELTIVIVRKLENDSLRKLLILQDFIREKRNEANSVKHVCIIIKTRKFTEKDIDHYPYRRGWRQITIEMIEGDRVKIFNPQDILNKPPQYSIQFNLKYIKKDSDAYGEIMSDMITVDYHTLDWPQKYDRIKQIAQVIQDKECLETLAQLLEKSFLLDDEKIKLSELQEFSYSSIFESSNWPLSLSSLIVTPSTKSRQQLSMIMIKEVMKQALKRHLPRIIVFLENENLISLYYSDIALFKRSFPFSVSLYSSENCKHVAGQKIEDLEKFNSPFTSSLLKLFEGLKNEQTIYTVDGNAEFRHAIDHLDESFEIKYSVLNLGELIKEIDTEGYLQDIIQDQFGHIANHQIQQFLCACVTWISFKVPLTKISIQAIVWLTESFFISSIPLLSCADFQQCYSEFMIQLKGEMQTIQTIDGYIPFTSLKHAFLRQACITLYPTSAIWTDYKHWLKSVKQPLHQLRVIQAKHLDTVKVQEMNVIQFLHQFASDILSELPELDLSQREQLFRDFSAKAIESFHTDIKKTIKLIQGIEVQNKQIANLRSELTYQYIELTQSVESSTIGLDFFVKKLSSEEEKINENDYSSIIKLIHGTISQIDYNEIIALISLNKDQIVRIIENSPLLMTLNKTQIASKKGDDSIQKFTINQLQEACQMYCQQEIREEEKKEKFITARNIIIDKDQQPLQLLSSIAFFRHHALTYYDPSNILYLDNLQNNIYSQQQLEVWFGSVRTTLYKEQRRRQEEISSSASLEGVFNMQF